MADRRFAVPLSYGQGRLWVLDRVSRGLALYNIPAVLRLTTAVDTDALARTLREIVRRHEALRTTFPFHEGTPVQLVSDRVQCELEIVDLEELVPEAKEDAARRRASEEAHKPFDLETGPLFRPTLIKIGPEQHLLLATFHHIVADGWSLGVFFSELKAIYSAFARNLLSPLAELEIQYPDYSVWQRQWLESGIMQEQIQYWRRKLDNLPALTLPADPARAVLPGEDSGRQAMMIPRDLAQTVLAASQQEGVTLFMFLLAAFQALLSRYSGQEDFAVATPVAGRGRPETEELIGFFVNIVVLRAPLGGDPQFRELLRRVRDVTLEAYAHQDTPFECLVEKLQPARDRGRNPLAQVMFSLQNTPLGDGLAEGVRTGWETDRGTANFDLAVDLWSTPSGIECRWEYRTDLFDDGTVELMMQHYQTLVESAVANLDEHVSRLPLLSESELLGLRSDGNKARPERTGTVATWFSQQAATTPKAIAAIAGEVSLSYRDLEKQSSQLARRLKQHGVTSGDIVAVALQRRAWAPIALLAVLKTGAAYLPVQLDAGGMVERSRGVLDDAGVKVVVTDAGQPDAFSPRTAVDIVTDWPRIFEESAAGLQRQEGGDDTAYVIYTSGSTGQPKGVVIPHRALLNHSEAIRERYGLCSADRVLQFAPLSFDVAGEEMFPTWLAGGTVVFPEAAGALSFGELRDTITTRQISVLNLPASYWQEWVDHLERSAEPLPESLRLVIVGSERVSVEHLRCWQRLVGPGVRWINAYGVTEATITAITYEAGGDINRGTVPIGRPIANVQAYVLDSHLQAVPRGVYGELYLGGLCLASKYLRCRELTAERFIASPFREGERLYATGDIVRQRGDGNLEFVGRADGQIKIAGYRIEPGEIEAALLRHPAVCDAAVGLVERTGSGSALVAWVAAEADLHGLREFLRGLIPRHMVPSLLVKVARLPRLPNGKIDRAALPAPRASDGLPELRVSPRNPSERRIAELWTEVLGVDGIGVMDSFFDLGGHSLMATQLISRIRAAMGYEVPLRVMFESPTVAGLASAIADGNAPLATHFSAVPVGQPRDVAAQVAAMSDEEVDRMLEDLIAAEKIEEESGN